MAYMYIRNKIFSWESQKRKNYNIYKLLFNYKKNDK